MLVRARTEKPFLAMGVSRALSVLALLEYADGQKRVREPP